MSLSCAVEHLPRCHPGEHAWCAFEDVDAFMGVVASYFADGVEQHQRLIWLSNVTGADRLGPALGAHGLDVSELVESGQLLVRPTRPIGSFDVAAAMEGWASRADQAEADGYLGLRVATEVPPPDGPVDESALVTYEFQADRALALSGSVALCGYDTRMWPREAVELVETFHGARVRTGARARGAPFTLRGARDGASLAGEVDAFDVDLFERAMTAVTADGCELVLDVTRLDFIGASGMVRLAHATQTWEQAGHRVVVRGASPLVRRCWSLFGFDTVSAVTFA